MTDLERQLYESIAFAKDKRIRELTHANDLLATENAILTARLALIDAKVASSRRETAHVLARLPSMFHRPQI